MFKRTILITVDCWRKDRLSVFGHNSKVLPNINKLTNNAAVFENMISNSSNTSPSFYALFTSKIPVVDGEYTPIPNNIIQFSEILRRNGIITCGIHSNPHLGIMCNYHKGFDDYFDMLEKPLYISWKDSIKRKLLEFLSFFKIKNKVLKIINSILNLTKIKIAKNIASIFIYQPYADAKATTAKAIEWISKNINSNFFLWIHYMDPHRPYFPSKKCISNISEKKITESNIVFMNKIIKYFKPYSNLPNKFEEKYLHLTNVLYDAELNFVDYYIGILFSYLKKNNIFDDTQIILTADHGEAIFEHNLLGHQVSLYDELLKIPLIIKTNDPNSPSKKIKNFVEIIDLAPTILDTFDIKTEKSFRGISLLPLIFDDNYPKKKDYIVSALLHNKNLLYSTVRRRDLNYSVLISIRTSKWKLIYDDETEKYELFNLKEDPMELINLNESADQNISLIKDYLSHLLNIELKKFNSEKYKIKRSILKNISIKDV